MGIFRNRPLCLFCFCFVLTLPISYFLSVGARATVLALLLLFAVVLFVLTKKKYDGKTKYMCITVFISLLFVCASLAQSIAVSIAQNKRSGRFTGTERQIHAVVCDTGYSSRFSSAYIVSVRYINGEKCRCDATVYLPYDGDLSAGDVIYFKGDISDTEANIYSESVLKLPQKSQFSISCEERIYAVGRTVNPRIAGKLISNAIGDRFGSLLGSDAASLSEALLTGDKSDLPAQTERDFRRAGLSHLLAVSGLHLSVLTCLFDLLLRLLCVPKKPRCIFTCAVALTLLAICGFSASAMRSVGMLLCAYLCFMLSSDSDALTALFLSATFILTVSPYTVSDVGFWLSLFATFGLVTWYVAVSGMMSAAARKAKRKNRFAVRARRAALKIVAAILTTVAANLFICIIIWYVFGEMSLVSIPANLILSPLCIAYLICSLAVLALGGIPVVGSIICSVSDSFAALIRAVIGKFSALESAVISLRYPFAGVITVVCTLAVFVLLIPRLRRKMLLILPPVVAAASFAVCFCIFSVSNPEARVTYIADDARDSVVLTKGTKAAICDISDGRYDLLYAAYTAARANYATETDAVYLTHYHSRHISSLDRLFRNTMVRKVYLPLPESKNETEIAQSILSVADSAQLEVIFFQRNTAVPLLDGEIMISEMGEVSYSSQKVAAFCVFIDGKLLTYVGSGFEASDISDICTVLTAKSDMLILGSHGPRPSEGIAAIIAAADADKICCADYHTLGILLPSLPQERMLPFSEFGKFRKCDFASD